MTQTTSERNKQIREINYLARDFDSYKKELIEYTKKYFPDDFQDFNEVSGGMALIEMIAYLGDNLSFLIDRSVNECFIDRAIEPKNIFSLAKNLGYKPKFTTPAAVDLTLSATFNNSTSSQSVFSILKGTRVTTDTIPSQDFEIIENVDFSSNSNRSSSVPESGFTTYAVSGVKAIAGITKTFKYSAGNPREFLSLELPDINITEIVSVSSSDGFEWYEVNNLAENTIFYGDENTNNATKDDVPYVLRLKRVPRRFIVEKKSGNRTCIVFGSGDSSLEDSEIIPNPDDFVLPPSLRGSPSGFTPALVDSSNFLNTKTLGVAPKNTVITVNYRIGGGIDSNVGRNTLKKLSNRIISFKNPNILNTNNKLAQTVLQTISVNNLEQATGGKEPESVTSIKQNALSFFNAQNRAVTIQDYQVRVLAMPSSFGSVYRSFARKDPNNISGVEIIIAAIDSNGFITEANGVLKNNVEKYIKQFKSFSDNVRISDPRIVNIGVNFSIVPAANVVPNQALLDSLLLMKDLLRTNTTNFNDNLVIADFISRIQSLSSVRSVINLNFTNINSSTNTDYSDFVFNIKSNTRNGILSFPPDVIWQVKFPDKDIVGRLA